MQSKAVASEWTGRLVAGKAIAIEDQSLVETLIVVRCMCVSLQQGRDADV